MRFQQNYDLYKANTMRLHSIVKEYFEPESVEDLLSLVNDLRSKGKSYLVMGAGSNVLLPPVLNKVAIGTMSFNNQVVIEGNTVKCGSSVRIQKLTRTCQDAGLGGIEFLFSVPCCLGGAIYMNAGAGKKVSISDFVISVEYYDPESNEVHIISKDEAEFSYRNSVFQCKPWIILAATLSLQKCSHETIEEKIQARLKFSHEKLDASKPSCGSVFDEYNSRIMDFLMGFRIGGACYSKKKSNWISNINNASYADVKTLIRIAELLHKITFKPCKREIIIIKK